VVGTAGESISHSYDGFDLMQLIGNAIALFDGNDTDKAEGDG